MRKALRSTKCGSRGDHEADENNPTPVTREPPVKATRKQDLPRLLERADQSRA